MQNYRASGRIPLVGLVLMLVGTALVGAVFGGALFFAERLLGMYLICIFPLVACVLGGGVFGLFVRLGKVRSPIIAGIVAIVAGLAIIAAYRGLTYFVGFREDLRQLAVEEGMDVTSDELIELENELLNELTGATGIVGFIRFSAQQGYEISYRSTTINLNEDMTWIYWGLEALVMVGVIAFIGMSAAGQPFDESSNAWFGKDTKLIGYVAWDARKTLYEALKAGDFRAASRLLIENQPPLPYAAVTYQTSGTESQQFYLEVDEYQPKRNNQSSNTTTLKGIITDQDLHSLQAEVKANTERLRQAQAVATSGSVGSALRR